VGAVRLLIVTSKSIHVLHEDFTSSKKEPRLLQAVQKMLVTAHRDYLVVLKMGDSLGDIILDTTPGSANGGEKISELAVVLTKALRTANKSFEVSIVSGEIDATTLAGQYQVRAEKGPVQPNGHAIFKSSRSLLKVSYSEL
jgi:hypothetical protein